MINEKHGYGRHTIDLELIEIKPGRYRWLFFIDGEHLTTSSDSLTCLETARDDALLIAHLQVERIDLRARTALIGASAMLSAADMTVEPLAHSVERQSPEHPVGTCAEQPAVRPVPVP